MPLLYTTSLSLLLKATDNRIRHVFPYAASLHYTHKYLTLQGMAVSYF